jgi:hypothetical protein
MILQPDDTSSSSALSEGEIQKVGVVCLV